MHTREQMQQLVGDMLDGHMADADIVSLLRMLAERGETPEEIDGAARAVMDRALPFEAPHGAVDVCGTGGDGMQSFNISTAVAFVVSACGVAVVKHGNRGVSSRSGSSDVLSAMGIPAQLPIDFWRSCLERFGIAFLYAPDFHAGLVRMAPIRKAMGTRTIFNVLGPLCNPAYVKRQLMGVYSTHLVPVIGDVMLARGMEAAWVVHGHDGGDELSISGKSDVAIIKHTSLSITELSPDNAGLTTHSPHALVGGTPDDNARAMMELFLGTGGAYRDSVLLNAAAALVIAGKCSTLTDGVVIAQDTIDSGRALALLNNIKDAAEKVRHV